MYYLCEGQKWPSREDFALTFALCISQSFIFSHSLSISYSVCLSFRPHPLSASLSARLSLSLSFSLLIWISCYLFIYISLFFALFFFLSLWTFPPPSPSLLLPSLSAGKQVLVVNKFGLYFSPFDNALRSICAVLQFIIALSIQTRFPCSVESSSTLLLGQKKAGWGLGFVSDYSKSETLWVVWLCLCGLRILICVCTVCVDV